MQKKNREKSSIKRSQYEQSINRSRPSSMKSSFAMGTRSHMTSSRVSFSSSRRNLASESTKQMAKLNWQIVDDDGVDVTPHPLVQLDVNVIKKTQSTLMDKDASNPSTALQQSLFGQSFSVPLTSSTAQGPFSSSVFGSISDIGTTGGSIIRSFTDEQVGTVMKKDKQIEKQKDFTQDQMTGPPSIPDSDPERHVHISLSETDTIWLLDMEGTSVAKDSEEAETVQRQNELYRQLVKGREGNDRYVQKGIQTVNFSQKIKGSQTASVEKKSSGVWATTWDIYDTYEGYEERKEQDNQSTESRSTSVNISRGASSSHVRGTDRSSGVSFKSIAPGQTVNVGERGATKAGTPSMMIGNQSSLMSVMGNRSVMKDQEEPAEREKSFDPSQPNDHPIMKLPSLSEKLLIMERGVLQNVYQEKQALYRGLPVLTDPDAEPSSGQKQFVIHKPYLERLWSLVCPQTKDKQAACVAWNKQNPDIVAVGYGNIDFSGQEEGLVCCWSLKNPEYPERVYKASSGVTSLSFSDTLPNLLAAGLYDGNVALYNLRTTNPECMLDTRDNVNSHFGPVWQVDWVEKERSTAEDRTEVLISIGSDGRVTQWSIRKGFEGTQLMRIKRPAHLAGSSHTNAKGKSKHMSGSQESASSYNTEALISQYTAGLAFDFWPQDFNIYLAGTQEGLIHKCSCSYNEQFLETYEGHAGPVLRIKWCPFLPYLFITCSADWSIKLWHQDKTTPMMSFTSAQCNKAIVDICWCPWNALVFASVSTGRVEVWDLSFSILDPYIVHKLSGSVQQCSVRFGVNAQVLLVGDAQGRVSVYQMRNVPPTPEDSVSDLLSAINKEIIVAY